MHIMSRMKSDHNSRMFLQRLYILGYPCVVIKYEATINALVQRCVQWMFLRIYSHAFYGSSTHILLPVNKVLKS